MQHVDLEVAVPRDGVRAGDVLRCSIALHAKRDQHILLMYAYVRGEAILDPELVQLSAFDSAFAQGMLNKRAMSGLVGLPKSTGPAGSLSQVLGSWFGRALASTASSLRQATETTHPTSMALLLTEPVVLLVDERVPRDTARHVSFQQLLPPTTPPTFAGTAFRITHSLVVGVQRLGEDQHAVELDFAVNVEPGPVPAVLEPVLVRAGDALAVDTLAGPGESASSTSTSTDSSGALAPPTAPAPTPTDTPLSHPRVAELAELSAPTPRSTPRSPRSRSRSHSRHSRTPSEINLPRPSGLVSTRFEVSANGVVLCTIQISKSTFRSGDMLVAQIANMQGRIRQVAVALESSEHIADHLRVRNDVGTYRATRRVWGYVNRSTLGLHNLGISLVVPPECPASFSTLHFSVETCLCVDLLLFAPPDSAAAAASGPVASAGVAGPATTGPGPLGPPPQRLQPSRSTPPSAPAAPGQPPPPPAPGGEPSTSTPRGGQSPHQHQHHQSPSPSQSQSQDRSPTIPPTSSPAPAPAPPHSVSPFLVQRGPSTFVPAATVSSTRVNCRLPVVIRHTLTDATSTNIGRVSP
ncbi:hypothetical protein SJAG_06588 [Schizosaccharomyces japonicus yFS275]|uniref:Uncharacterized protein n=1 Tax=Schizosaccharomyces japonicus (strain yFS275 / FY16936) TaxID=402676 RepID=T0S361_SCHJY|nr:hypothetical protein SJAG_06588 [Schizosaccharomyces japonicus yFS275]EQC53066.1 hypothetical protein SJAG_06588 [Schizosaccharomyces japonicus yFS275]